MSLINQMLKDLEKRSRPLTVPDYFVSGTRSSSPATIRRKKLIVLIVSVLAFILSLTYLITHWNVSQEVSNSAQANSTIAPVNELNPVSNASHHGMNTLTGITVEVQNDLTDLRLLLGQDVLYTVTQDEKQRLVIELEQTQLIANIPSFVNNMDSALLGLEMTNLDDGNLKMTFTLKEGATLSHLNLHDSNKLPELQLIFQYHPTGQADYVATAPEPITLQKKEGAVKKLRYDVNLDESYQYALQLASDNRVEEAITSLKSILNQDPGFSPARETIATLLLKKGDLIEVQEILTKGLALQPNYAPYIKLKAEMLVQQGKTSDALKLLLFSPPDITEDSEYFAFIAALYQQNEQYLPAKELYEKLLTLKPNNSTWWIGLGISLESMGERRQAADAFHMASRDINLQPDIKEYVEARLDALQ